MKIKRIAGAEFYYPCLAALAVMVILAFDAHIEGHAAEHSRPEYSRSAFRH